MKGGMGALRAPGILVRSILGIGDCTTAYHQSNVDRQRSRGETSQRSIGYNERPFRGGVMNRTDRWVIALIIAACLSAAAASGHLATNAAVADGASSVQDPAGLDRRVSMLEQRTFIIEASIRRLEQQANMRPTLQPDQTSAETVILRNEVARLRNEMQVVQCALAKLDERTLSPELRLKRDQNNSYKDPCRIRPETPLQMPVPLSR
jgi:hypothetical protein